MEGTHPPFSPQRGKGPGCRTTMAVVWVVPSSLTPGSILISAAMWLLPAGQGSWLAGAG